MIWFTRLPADHSDACRRQHERWLTRAIASERPAFRIPTRRVDRGGFARLVARESGRRWAAVWWSRAFDRLTVEE